MGSPLAGKVDPPKQPAELLKISVDFVKRIPDTVTINSAVVTSRNYATGANTTATIVSGAATFSGSVVTQKVHAGTSGETHMLTFSATLSDTQVLENEVLLPILEF